MNTTSVEVTAGLGGFLVLFCLGLAVWLLGRDLSRRLRRMRLAEEQRLSRERDAAAAGRAAPSAPAGPASGEDGEERGRPV